MKCQGCPFELRHPRGCSTGLPIIEVISRNGKPGQYMGQYSSKCKEAVLQRSGAMWHRPSTDDDMQPKATRK